MLVNASDKGTRGNNVGKELIDFEGVRCEYRDITEEFKRQGLHKKVYLPLVGLGKIGITTLTKMSLHEVYGIPLTYGKYKAHGIELGTAVAEEHDKAHGKVDNRRREVLKAVISLLKKVRQANKPVKQAIPLAARHMVERYLVFNETLLAYMEAKERTAIDELEAAITLGPELDARRAAEKAARETYKENSDALAIALATAKASAPDEERNRQREVAETAARRKYNIGVAALFHALHEVYAMRANVLEASNLQEALKRLGENATLEHNTRIFDELETFFDPLSDLNDRETFEKIKGCTLESVGIPPEQNGSAPVPTTIGEYLGYLDMESLKVHRGPVYTEVTFDTNNGKLVKIPVPTTHYLVNTARDENAVLGLIGKKVPELTLDMADLRALPKGDASRVAALAQVKDWLTQIRTGSNEMVAALQADVLTNLPLDALEKYNALVASQNAEWLAAGYLPVVAPVSVPAVVIDDLAASSTAGDSASVVDSLTTVSDLVAEEAPSTADGSIQVDSQNPF